MKPRLALLALLTLPLVACGNDVDNKDYKWVHTTDERTGTELACFVAAGYRNVSMHCVEVSP